MNIKLTVAAILVAGLASPAHALSYYVVQNMRTYKCSAAIKKPLPRSNASMLVGDGTVYKSRKEATDAIKTIAACNTIKRPAS
jgi:hypothetical protein